MKRLSVLVIVSILVMIYLLIGCGEVDDGKPCVSWGCENPSYDHIKYLGYYSASPWDDVKDYVNASINGYAEHNFISGGSHFYNRETKEINWDAWDDVVERITPQLDHIAGIYIMDEPHIAMWYPPSGHSDGDIETIVNLYRETFPDTKLWINYDWENASRNIPKELDYISVTPAYDESPGCVYQGFVNEILANMYPHQEMFLIGDGYNWDVGREADGFVPEYWDEYKAETARDYIHIAACDERITGIFTFIYSKGTPYTNAYDMPLLQDELEDIFNEVFE
jgi:hypothetical protein